MSSFVQMVISQNELKLPGRVEKSPSIMCVQYIGGRPVHRGTSSTSGGVQYIGGYHEYIGGCSVHQGDIMMNVGVP